MRTSIKLYEINTAFHEAMILCFRILLTKDFDVIKKDAIYDGAWPRPTLLGDMEFFLDALWCEQNKRGPVVGWNVLPNNTASVRQVFRPFAFRILLSPYFRYVLRRLHNSANFLSSKSEFLVWDRKGL